MDYSSDDSVAESDEIAEVKRVLREAKARKRSLNMKLCRQSEKIATDKGDMLSTCKKQSAEIQRLTAIVSDLELELRSARFEIGHSVLRETKKSEEISILQFEHRNVVNELQSKLQEQDRIHKEQIAAVFKAADKLSGIVNSIHSSVCESKQYLEYKSCKQLLNLACQESSNLKVLVGGCSSSEKTSTSSSSQTVVKPSSINPPSSSLDSTLMDMCRSLEEENSSLITSMEQLKKRLAAAEEEVAKNNLIPHYRLAIVRARSYTANLLEQLKREQFTSESLREQLDLTYADLKRMAEEKRSLYRKLSKHGLETDRQTHYENADFHNEYDKYGRGDERPLVREPTCSSSSGDCKGERISESVAGGGHPSSRMDDITALDKEIGAATKTVQWWRELDEVRGKYSQLGGRKRRTPLLKLSKVKNIFIQL